MLQLIVFLSIYLVIDFEIWGCGMDTQDQNSICTVAPQEIETEGKMYLGITGIFRRQATQQCIPKTTEMPLGFKGWK